MAIEWIIYLVTNHIRQITFALVFGYLIVLLTVIIILQKKNKIKNKEMLTINKNKII